MPLDRLLTLRALTRLLRIPRATIQAWVADGQFPAPIVLPGGKIRWRSSAVSAWISVLSPAEGVGIQSADLDDMPELAREILQVLDESPKEWMNGSEIAAKIGGDASHNSTSWKRASARLRQAHLVETDRIRGMRLGPAWKRQDQSEGPT